VCIIFHESDLQFGVTARPQTVWDSHVSKIKWGLLIAPIPFHPLVNQF